MTWPSYFREEYYFRYKENDFLKWKERYKSHKRLSNWYPDYNIEGNMTPITLEIFYERYLQNIIRSPFKKRESSVIEFQKIMFEKLYEKLENTIKQYIKEEIKNYLENHYKKIENLIVIKPLIRDIEENKQFLKEEQIIEKYKKDFPDEILAFTRRDGGLILVAHAKNDDNLNSLLSEAKKKGIITDKDKIFYR
ncbi:MAG: hypothetical protein ACTSQS_04765 [Promethearchaeota archaeon]